MKHVPYRYLTKEESESLTPYSLSLHKLYEFYGRIRSRIKLRGKIIPDPGFTIFKKGEKI